MKSKHVNVFSKREPWTLWPQGQRCGPHIANGDQGQRTRNRLHSRAHGPQNTCISSDISHVLIFIFLGMLGLSFNKVTTSVAMEPNQKWSMLLGLPCRAKKKNKKNKKQTKKKPKRLQWQKDQHFLKNQKPKKPKNQKSKQWAFGKRLTPLCRLTLKFHIG